MNHMMIILTLTMLSASASWAKSFSFFYPGFEGRNRVFLSCDYAENQAKRLLDEIGVEVSQSRCYGGIQPGGGWIGPITVNIKYDFKEDSKQGDIFTLRSGFNDNCYYDTRFLNQFIRKNKSFYKVIRRKSNCFSSDSTYSFEVEVK